MYLLALLIKTQAKKDPEVSQESCEMSLGKVGKRLHQGEHQGEAKCPKPGRADEKREGAWERQGEGREENLGDTGEERARGEERHTEMGASL